MDATCRELLRAWRRDPTDAVAADACAAALHRARVELPWELIPALTRWRWPLRLVSRFAAVPPTEADGWPEAELLAAEARLGLRLPAALREWYRVAGQWAGAPELVARLIPPTRLEVVDRELVIQRGPHGQLGVRGAALSKDDPPLRVRKEWGGRYVGQRLARTLVGNALHELVQAGPLAFGVVTTRVDGLRGTGRHGWHWAGSEELEQVGLRSLPLGEWIEVDPFPGARRGLLAMHVDDAGEVLLHGLHAGAGNLLASTPAALERVEARLAPLRPPEK